MALLGISKSLEDRGIQNDLKVVVAAKAGVLYMLGSQSNYVQLASQAVSHILDWEVDADGISASDVLFGAEVEQTKVDDYAHLRPLAPGDTFRTDQLQSGSDTGAIDGTLAPNVELGVNPATGKLRQKQATDNALFRIASDGGNLFDTDGSIWVEVVALGRIPAA